MNNDDESNGNEVVSEDSGRCQSCSCISSIKNKMRATTVEPVMFLYSVTMMLTMSSVTNLLLERVCLVVYHEDAETCRNMSSNATLHENVQTYTATLEMYLTLIMNLPSLLIGLIAGAYSDIHGRKVPLLMPLVGTTIQCIGLIVFSYLERLDPRWILLCGVPNALTGGFTVFIMAIFSYMSDISKQRSRTGRIGGLSIAFYIGSMLGYYLSNVILQYLGYWPLFTISAALSAINVLYVAICVKNYIVTSAEQVENIPSQRSLLYHCWQSTVSAAHACVRGRLLYTRAVLLILITSLTLFTFSFRMSIMSCLYLTALKMLMMHSYLNKCLMLLIYFKIEHF